MATTQLIQHGLHHFATLDEWNLPSLQLLEKYLLTYEKLPSYKKLLYSMILFSDMYRPLDSTRRKKLAIPGLAEVEQAENAHRALKRAEIYMNKRKLIRAVDEKGRKSIVVTSSGEKNFYKQYPLAKLRQKKWDGIWRMVMYDFPEEKRALRNQLRRDLKKYGFGSPQISIYISPLQLATPIQQLIESKDYQKYVWVTRAETVLGKSNVEIARDSWPLAALNDLYTRLGQSYFRVLDNEELEIFWQSCFLAVDHQNPYLPKELLPEDWQEETCRKLFEKLSGNTFLDVVFG